jgi:predicted ATPase
VAIQNLHIEGFRSIYAADLKPRPLTALVGPNNSGKSTFAEALDFLSDVARSGLEVAVARKGGYDNIAFRKKQRTRRALTFAITYTLQENDFGPLEDSSFSEITLNYAFSFIAASESRSADFSIQNESLYITGKRTRSAQSPLVEVRREADNVVLQTNLPDRDKALTRLFEPLDDRGYANFLLNRVSPTKLLIADLDVSYVVWWFLNDLGNTRIYRLAPGDCRKPGSPTPNPHLNTTGENLPAVAQFLSNEHPGAWDQVMGRMRGIMPNLESIQPAFTSDRRLTLLFHESGFGRPWTSAEVSDGTIQSLALFTALFDPRIDLTLIEEPENSIHPWIIRLFVDASREVHGKQVMVTTHSPALIAYLTPDDVSVVWRDDGRTHIASLVDLDADVKRLWESGEFNLFDLTDGGYIRQTIPQGFA